MIQASTTKTDGQETPSFVSRLSFAISVISLLIALMDMAIYVIIQATKSGEPVWMVKPLNIIPQAAVFFGVLGIFFNVLEITRMISKREDFDPKDTAKGYTVDDLTEIINRVRPGCLTRLTFPVALMASIIALLLQLIIPLGNDRLQVYSDNASQSCTTTSPLETYTFTLDNTASTITITWSAIPVEMIGNLSWAQLDTTSGSIAPGQQVQVRVIPYAGICQYLFASQSPSITLTDYMINTLRSDAAANFHVRVMIHGQTQRTTTISFPVEKTATPTATPTPTAAPLPNPTAAPIATSPPTTTVTQTPPPPPTLISPGNHSIVALGQSVTFQWSTSGIWSLIQLYTPGEGWNTPGWQTATSYTFTPTIVGTYGWVVTASNGGNLISSQSPVWQFTVQPPPPANLVANPTSGACNCSTTTFMLTNTGGTPATVSSAPFTAYNYSCAPTQAHLSPLPVTINPNQSITMTAYLGGYCPPNTNGSADGTFTINWTDTYGRTGQTTYRDSNFVIG